MLKTILCTCLAKKQGLECLVLRKINQTMKIFYPITPSSPVSTWEQKITQMDTLEQLRQYYGKCLGLSFSSKYYMRISTYHFANLSL